MASKAATVNGEERPIKRQEPGALSNVSGNLTGSWARFTQFLTDVRVETRKVVTPSRKEVESTTAVVLITVFFFGLFFLLTDFVFNRTITAVLHRLGGAQ